MIDNIESQIEGLTWPAIPTPLGTNALALLYQLEKTQWWALDTLRKYQFQQLSKILIHAYETIRFYRDRIDAAGIDPRELNSLVKLGCIPLLTRPELQETGPELLSKNIPKSHGQTFETSTSGATGRHVKVTNTSLASLFWKVFYLRENVWHCRDLSKKMAAIRYADRNAAMAPHGLNAKVWGSPEQGTFKTGPAVLLNIKSPISQQVEWLIREKPDYLASYPSNILALANHFIAEGKSLPGLLHVRTVGEILGPEVRKACQDAWNAPVVDMYSCQEAGVIALQCPEHDHYHLQSETMLVEILNGQDDHCLPGEIGRVVITTLHNFAMPLIRYEVGDYAEVGVPCACGRGLPVLKQILGRQRNMLQLPNGEQVWPVLGFMYKLEVDTAVKQFQLIQKDLDHLEVLLVTERPFTAEEESRVILRIQKQFNYPLRVTFSYRENIPRSKGGKYEDFMTELP